MPENPSRSRTADRILSRRSREDYVFQSHDTPTRNRQICEAQRRIDDQRARVQRTIVQGCPTQSADDLLSKLCEALRHLGEQPKGPMDSAPRVKMPKRGGERFSVTEPERPIP
jgi:hypothetical protein